MPTLAKREVTVESCIAELREMFPDIEMAHYDILNRQLILHLPDQWIKYFSGDSISEAMAQVRKWKESQSS